MDTAGGSGGRGRGRGRTAPSQSTAATTPAAAAAAASTEVAPVVPQESVSRSDDVRSSMFDRGSVAPLAESDRGRSRGRGAGRGRNVESRTREESPPARQAEPISPEAMKDLMEKFADLPAPASPEDPGGEPVDEGSPSTQPVPTVADGVEPMPGGTNGDQKGSVSSTGGGTSGAAGRKEDETERVISRIGKGGAPLDLKTNYMRLKQLDGYAGLVEYHVSMDPAPDNVRVRRRVLSTEACTAVVGNVRSFDGMVLYLPMMLNKDVNIIKTRLPSNPDTEIKVQITFVKTKPMADAVIFFNILLHKCMILLGYEELRQEFYDVGMARTFDQHKLVVWPGYAVTSENQEGGLMICVDTCNRIMRKDTVYDQMVEIRREHGAQFRQKFEEFIIGKIVLTKYNTKCYKVDSVKWDTQPNSTFMYRNNEVTYVDYLRERYPDMEERVTDMNQPMLISKLKPRKNEKFSTEVRLAALVPQCCYITGLTEEQKANYKVMTDLAESTRHVPNVRVQNLQKLIKRFMENTDVTQLLANWGLRVERDIIDVQGRRMDGPDLDFGRQKLKPATADFSRESGRNVYKPVPVRNYVIICTSRDADKARRFMDCYKEVSGPLGIKTLQGGQIVTLKGNRPSDFSDALRANCDPDKVHFVVILMPMARDDTYAAIKRHCVATKPIPSQCIVTKTLNNEKKMRNIVIKIALQINCKLGGSLWALRLPEKLSRERIMFIGIDAAHDPLKKDASVICLVASLNNECTTYFSKSYTSKVHQELADSLGGLTRAALEEYRKLNSGYPTRIVVFRDGGSLGALDVIGTTEVDQMKKAAEICGDALQHFTFAVVTKRIPQRFFLKNARALENPPPGTVIDNVVTRRHIYDFYIVSQLVRQGTVNPTHFVVIDSDDPIKPDLIQRFAYITSFMYYNWAGTVRVPAMVQYAHKLSALLIRHVKTNPHPDMATTLYYL